MPLQATSGAASYDAFGGGVPVVPAYIEEVFSTWLTTGTGSGSQTITNGIDLSGKGGMVWWKTRNSAYNHYLFDTNRGATNWLVSNQTSLQETVSNSLTSFNSDGFTIGDQSRFNGNTFTDVAWTFRKQPKFFDVVTYTGTGSNTTIAHNLGSVPACIMVKRTDATGAWQVYHRSLANTEYLVLNDTAAKATGATRWNSTTPTSTVFSLGTDATVNASSGTYVAYLFAHNAGGFGLTGTDNVISCGSFTTDGGGNGSATLGYEPQWVLFKRTDSTQNWVLMDNMRNFVASPNDSSALYPNLSSAESVFGQIAPNATGFSGSNFSSSASYIYIAIRRGPMKVPTVGTSVFNPAYGTNVSGSFDTSFPVDFGIYSGASIATGSYWSSRLTASQYLNSFNINAEGTFGSTQPWDRMEDWFATADNRFIGWGFRRAPSFMDVVCYTGNDTARTLSHNLGVAPELMIVKVRTVTFGSGRDWNVYAAPLNNVNAGLYLNLNNGASGSGGAWNGTVPTSSVFTVGTNADVNFGGWTYVAYLFATCAGVSKVGSYTGNGTTQTINCGFTGGARFVLIKKTSGTGDWMVSDSARGIVSGNDPYLELNNTNAEVTGEDWLDTDSTGFVVNEVSGSNANTSSATYIFLAIA